MKTFLGIEIGGTKLQIVVGQKPSDAPWEIEERVRFAVAREQGAHGIRSHLEDSLPPLVKRYDIGTVGVGFGGPVDWKTGRTSCSHQIEGWSDFELGAWLHSFTKVPVFVDNDANVAALAEATLGAGVGYNPVFYVTLGSGIGGGLVVDGKIYHGAKPGESEIGHIRLDKIGTTLESRCSGWAIDQKIRGEIARNENGIFAKLADKSVGNEARFLTVAIEADDSSARRILDETAENLAFGLSHAVHLFHPETVVLGGGLSLLGEPFRLAVEHFLPGFLMEIFTPRPKISLAKTKEDAVPLGALELALRNATDVL